jgi:hypothetical protein
MVTSSNISKRSWMLLVLALLTLWATPSASQVPACQNSYDCCLKRNPANPDICGASPTPSPPQSAPKRLPPPLSPEKGEVKRPVNRERCLDSCAAGGQVFIQFCNDIKDTKIRAACFSKSSESETSCRNFCFNYFGD